MKRIFRRASLAGLALAAALLVSAASDALAQEDKVIATVGTEQITEADLTQALSDLDQQFARLPEDQRRAAALSAVIEIKLLAAEAKSKGFDKDAAFQRRLAFLEQRALHAEVIEKEVAAKITEEAIRKKYDTEIANTPPVNEVHARHILVKTKEEADAIIKQLDGGAKFEDIANEKTTDPSGKTSGGDLGWFGPGQMVPEFEKAAFALDVGAYTKMPVQSQFGFHIIKVEDKRAKQPPAYEQVKEQFRSLLLRDNYFALVKSLRAAGKVEVTDPTLKAAVDQIDKGQ